MTEIKICGITDPDDAHFAVSCGIDALGFIFYTPSPRHVEPETAKKIISGLPHTVTKVGVFVNHDAAFVRQTVDYCGLDLIQLHGNETIEYCMQFSQHRVIKVISSIQEDELADLQACRFRAVLVDARDNEHYGGTGKQADWGIAYKAKAIAPLILAGGLNADNIVKALSEVIPDAVDINSGVETAPGKKDWKKIQRVTEMVRNLNNKQQGDKKIFIGKIR